MAVTNIGSIKPKVWIPPTYHALYKLIAVRTDGTEDDLTDIAHYIQIEDGVTEVIGKFEFELWNPDSQYTNLWTGNNTVLFYCDYATTATTLRFRGRIEQISKLNNKIRVTGRSEGLKFLNVNVTKSYASQECSVILKDLIDSYGSGFTSTNVSVSTASITTNWYEKNFWECIEELCTSAGFFCYVDANKDFHFKNKGSVTNTGEGIVHGSNLMSVSDFADDVTLVKNKIKVYGATQDGIQLIYTAEDADSQTLYGLREEIINDDNITSYDQAKDYADNLLVDAKTPPVVGEITGTMLATIQPGENIPISSPANGIEPKAWDILSYTHTMDLESGFTTTVKVNKEPRRTKHILKGILAKTNRKQSTSANPEQMLFSYNHLFDVDSGTHSNTEIVDGVLKLQAGESSGVWTSSSHTAGSDVSEAYLISIGQTLTSATYEVSANAGVNYKSISDKSKVSITNTGQSVILRITITSADTQIDSVSLQYK